jgi:hypothetical protein
VLKTLEESQKLGLRGHNITWNPQEEFQEDYKSNCGMKQCPSIALKSKCGMRAMPLYSIVNHSF